MARVTTDIDIDFADRDNALEGLMTVSASMGKNGVRQRHQSGVYFQNIPTDPIDGYASLDHHEAADNGYFKIDFLNQTVYKDVRDEEHLQALIDEPVEWEMFEFEEIVSKLTHINTSFGIVKAIKPQNIDDLAVILALMRPAKRHLLGQPRDKINAEIWTTGDDGFAFKRAHAYAYAMLIIVHLNVICEKMGEDLDNNIPLELLPV